MSGEGEMVPDWQLERFRLQELSPAEQESVAGAAERSEAVRARLAELERSDREILAHHPPRRAAEAIRARTGRPLAPRPTRGLRPALAVAASVAALLALAQLWPPWRGPTTIARPPDETRIKGTRPELVIYRQADRGAEPLGDGALVRAHDVVQVLYVAGSRYGVIVSVDGRGGVTVHLPAGEPRAAELAENRPTPLASAYELDDAPAFERFFFVTSSAPFDVALVTDAARRLASPAPAEGPTRLDLPLAFGQSTFLLRKDGPR